jgi:enoyl-CoA hydratase/carnithine racemase
MGTETFITVDRRDDGVALVRLDRPKMNALSSALLEQLAEAAEALTENPPGAVVVWGGDRIFAAGADISEFGGPAEARTIGGRFRQALDAVAAIPRATIAAVNGYALGGGCELALACDLRVAADTAKFGQPEILLGIIPGGGGTQRLPRLVPFGIALELLLTGDTIDAAEAYRIGLVNRVVPADGLLAAAEELARRMLKNAPLSLQAVKEATYRGISMPLDEGLRVEAFLSRAIRTTQDSAEGPTAFAEKRQPSWQGR